MQNDVQAPSTSVELRKHLKNYGYQQSGCHVGSDWAGCGDAHCIEKTDSGFNIFYFDTTRHDTTRHDTTRR